MSKILPAALLCFLATTASTSADVLVQKRVEADDYTAPASPVSSVEPIPRPRDGASIDVWVDGDRVRRDEEAASFILRPSDGALYVVFHESRAFSRLAWPIPYDRHRPQFLETLAASAPELLPFEVEQEDPAAPVVVETLPAERWTRTVANGMGRRYRVVLDRAPTVPPERARALRAVFELDHALAKLSNGGPSPLDSTVSGQSADAAAPVRWLLARQEPETEIRYGERVVEIDTDAAAPPGGYAPPEGYEEVPFEPETLWSR